jgi:hypothetical protein
MTIKKCPECYAIMRKTVPLATSSASLRQPKPESSDATALYECSQCGYIEKKCA